LLVMAAGCYWTSLLNLYISPWQVIWPRIVLIIGLSLIFAPLNVAAYLYTPRHLRGAAVGLFSLLRNEGGSVGTSMAQTIQERREQFHLSRVGEFIDPLNPHVQEFFARSKPFFYQQSGDPAGSQLLSLQVLADLRQQQASSLAYFDVFWFGAALGIGLVLLVLFMKRSVAEKGAHVAAD
jgi:DHA2 family multidrug resistance protein